MKTGPDYELLKDAYAIIDGIPETAIALDKLQTTRGESLEHGTICSPAGWLAQHPKFMKLGLSLSEDGGHLLLRGESDVDATPTQIMGRIFSLEPADADLLFGARSMYTLGDDSGLSDKRLWLHEVREFLKAHEQIPAEFEERLETRGLFSEPANPAEIRTL
ncbi:MAG TPA: hypothetical protein VHK70_05200 [Burkholderiaceae bacterium]|jgi:hypothetical protein|nr:hypothetical protein [Burkholderiaceae bacterium]